jgi:hypothetical protein
VNIPVAWSDEADDAIAGDLTAAIAYVTPAGGVVVTAVATCGVRDRGAGALVFTTSLGLSKKLERIIRDPSVALAYHAREHGFSSSSMFVLAQGHATVTLTPSNERLEDFIPAVEPFLGKIKRGPMWTRFLREYYWERVFVDIVVTRMVTWEALNASGDQEIVGAPLPEPPPAQSPPKKGTAPRVKMPRVARQIAKLPYRLIGFRGTDGFPVIVPVSIEAHGPEGFRIGVADGLLPPGGRRAGLLAHGYRAQLIGLGTRTMTGWLEVDGEGKATYAPHTCKGWSAPPVKGILLVMNGLLAKVGYRRAVRNGVLERLRRMDGAQDG